MDIVRKDFEKVWNDISGKFLNGFCGIVFNNGHQVLHAESYTTGSATDEFLKFNQNSPLPSADYKLMDLSGLYHVMNGARLLGMDKLNDSTLVQMDKLWQGYEMLDSVIVRFKNIDWYYDYSDDSSVWARGNKEVNLFIQDLRQYNTPELLALLHSLWGVNVPKYSVQLPDFLHTRRPVMVDEILSGQPSEEKVQKPYGLNEGCKDSTIPGSKMESGGKLYKKDGLGNKKKKNVQSIGKARGVSKR